MKDAAAKIVAALLAIPLALIFCLLLRFSRIWSSHQ
jgi:hypothetical protein